MFSTNSKIKIGYGVEYAYDVEGCTPFSMKLVENVTDYVAILTDDIDAIVLTKDTRILTARGLWVSVDKLEQGELLKNVVNNKTVVNIIPLKSPINMYEVSDTDYVIVNGFYII